MADKQQSKRTLQWDGLELLTDEDDIVRLRRVETSNEAILSVEEEATRENSAAILTIDDAKALRRALDGFIKEQGAMGVNEEEACPLNTPCEAHGQYHGGEAEELRKGIEKLIEGHEVAVAVSDLIKLLDDVNARDSLAYREATDT